jgi:hypothetical protein
MAEDDWAIVVGIKKYFDPQLSGLEGPENDAKEFHRWLIDPQGGNVPGGQAQLILSSGYPPFTAAATAMPTAEAIKAAFDHFQTVADANADAGAGRTVGRRLYLFFSGHGFAPSHRDDLTAMLTAEAQTGIAMLAHVIGSYMADHYWRARFFQEILLFMDCCREIMECAQLYMPYSEERASNYYTVKRFYAYGARVANASREWKMVDGQFHGVFTRTLMDALRGAGCHPDQPTKVTAESLRDQLYNTFKGNLSPFDQARSDIPKEPEIVYEQKPGGDFTIVDLVTLSDRVLRLKSAPKTTGQIKITVSAENLGRTATIRDQDLKSVRDINLEGTPTVDLELGFYSITVPGGAPVPFEVIGPTGEIQV